MLAPLKKVFSRYAKGERGSFSVEAILMFPMLVFGWIGLFVFFEGLRENNINLKAAYTVGDLLSRETEEVNMDYLNGMNTVFRWLTRSQNDVAMRVTVVRFDEDANQHVRVWSRGVGGKPDLTQLDVDTIVTPVVPILADADTAIVVETWAYYEPIMEMGLTNTELYNIVVTAPRFTEQLKFEGIDDGGGDEHDDNMDGQNEGI